MLRAQRPAAAAPTRAWPWVSCRCLTPRPCRWRHARCRRGTWRSEDSLLLYAPHPPSRRKPSPLTTTDEEGEQSPPSYSSLPVHLALRSSHAVVHTHRRERAHRRAAYDAFCVRAGSHGVGLKVEIMEGCFPELHPNPVQIFRKQVQLYSSTTQVS